MAGSNIDISGPEKIMTDLKKALSTNVRGARAGFLANDKGKKAPKEKNVPDIADVALWNEHGTETIPARPFLRNAQYKLNEVAPRLVQIGMEENKSIAKIAGEIGIKAQELIVKEIRRGNYTPNAESTIKRKGSSRPLVDTGNMSQSVHWGIIRSGNNVKG